MDKISENNRDKTEAQMTRLDNEERQEFELVGCWSTVTIIIIML